MLEKIRPIAGQYNDTIGELVWDSFRGLMTNVFARFERIDDAKYSNSQCAFMGRVFQAQDYYFKAGVPEQFVVDNERCSQAIDNLSDESFVELIYDGIDILTDSRRRSLDMWKNEISKDYSTLESHQKAFWNTIPERIGSSTRVSFDDGKVTLDSIKLNMEDIAQSIHSTKSGEGREVPEGQIPETETCGYLTCIYSDNSNTRTQH